MSQGPRQRPATPISEEVSRRMARTRGRDTAPELAIRRILHARGLRYFVDRAPIQGLRRRADVVFPRARVAVYVDGCFFHGCPQHGTWPKHNAEFWRDKIETNRARDLDTDARLEDAGWAVIRVWEHEDPAHAAHIVEAVVTERRALRTARKAPAGR
jgi:DNA mismatch endonuclease (patch repair protein)